ncbi:hypothetical protein DSECCO2_592230 [anaerobic digester metagenome]
MPGDHLGLVLHYGAVPLLALRELPFILAFGRDVLDDQGGAVPAVLEDGRDQREAAVDGPSFVLEGDLPPLCLRVHPGVERSEPFQQPDVGSIEGLAEEVLAGDLPEPEKAVVCLDDPPRVIDDQDLLLCELEESRERDALRCRVDLGHADLPDLDLSGEEEDLEVFRGRVAVHLQPLGDLGDDQPLGMRLEERANLPHDRPVLFQAHADSCALIY